MNNPKRVGRIARWDDLSVTLKCPLGIKIKLASELEGSSYSSHLTLTVAVIDIKHAGPSVPIASQARSSLNRARLPRWSPQRGFNISAALFQDESSRLSRHFN